MTAPARKPTERVTLAGFVGYWVLRGIARQIGVDARSGVLTARGLFRTWMRQRWQQVPRPVRASAFAVGVTARAGYRAGRYAGRTVATGTERGLVEGWHRHRESAELRAVREQQTRHADVVRANRTQRAGWSESKVRQASRTVLNKIPTMGPLKRGDRREWAKVESLADVGDITARWLEGGIESSPGYYGRPAEETTDLIPALATLNRAGFVTYGSQPGVAPERGCDGEEIWQRAALDGFTDRVTADRMEAACIATGLTFIRHSGASRRMDYRTSETVTASGGYVTGDGSQGFRHTDFGARLSRRQVNFSFDGYAYDDLINAEQVTIIDPEWGRNNMWGTLTDSVNTPTEALDAREVNQLVNRCTRRSCTPGMVSGGDGCPECMSRLREVHPGLSDISLEAALIDHSNELAQLDDYNRGLARQIPQYPGPDDGTPDHAQRLAAWQQWRAQQPGWERFTPEPRETMECPDCLGDVCETCDGDGTVPTWLKDPNVVGEDAARIWGWTGNTESTTNGGTAMTAPTSNAGGDVVSIADLRDVYQRTGPAMAGVQEQQAAAAAGFRNQAAAYESAVGGLTSEGHDPQTISEAAAAMEAMHEAATKADEAAAAADAAQAAIGAAEQGLERHRALEEAVGTHPGVATRTDAYAPR